MINELAIKQVVNTQGWKEVEKIIIEEVENNKLPANFSTSGKTNEEIARECSAREMASNIIKQCLNNIYRVAGKKEFKKESWE